MIVLIGSPSFWYEWIFTSMQFCTRTRIEFNLLYSGDVVVERNSEYYCNILECSWSFMNLHILECSWRFMNLHPPQFCSWTTPSSWILFHELNSWLHECSIISSWVVHDLFLSWSQPVQEYNSWIFLNCSWSIPNHLAGEASPVDLYICLEVIVFIR